MPTARVQDVAIRYEDRGSGEPIVLVHGHPFDHTMWAPQIERFSASGRRVIAPDLRGYGASDVVPGKVLLDDFAADILALLDDLGVDGFVLGGLSMGGQIAMELLRQAPARVRALLLADTSAAAETPDGKRVRNELADRILRDGIAPYADEVLPRMISPHTIATRPAVAEHVLRMMRATSPEGAAAALRGRAERRDYRELLARVAVPALVIVGSDDDFTPVADARSMHETIPGSTLAIVDGAGHMPNLERPAEFDAAFEGLLAAAVTAA